MAKTGTGKYEPVVDELRGRIAEGALSPGDWMPSEATLMERYGVSRYSAREAIKRLAAEGLIVVVDGKGSYVRARRERASHADVRGIYRNGDGAPFRDADSADWQPVEKPGTYRTNATVDLALALQVPEHTPLFVHDRLLEHPSGRRMVHRLCLPMTTCLRVEALAEDPFRAPDQLYGVLVDAGLQLAWTEHVRAATPTPDDTTALRVPTGAAVLITRRVTTNTADGRPLALEETRRSAEDTQLTYPLTPVDQPATVGPTDQS